MPVFDLTHAERDLLLAGADLEAVLADREKEKLEQDERTGARPGAGVIVRLGRYAPVRDEAQDAEWAPAEV